MGVFPPVFAGVINYAGTYYVVRLVAVAAGPGSPADGEMRNPTLNFTSVFNDVASGEQGPIRRREIGSFFFRPAGGIVSITLHLLVILETDMGITSA